MANHNKFNINSELPTPGANREVANVSPESSQEQEPQAQNPAEQNVENTKTRLEALEGRGAEIRGKATEKIKEFGRGAVGLIDRSIGRVASGAEKMKGRMADAREYAGNLKDAAAERISQRQARKERKRTTKERAINDQFTAAKIDEAEALSGVRAGDADAFNYMEPGTKAEQAGRQQAKQEAIDAAHAEALEENKLYDNAYGSRKRHLDNLTDEDLSVRKDRFNADFQRPDGQELTYAQKRGLETAGRDALEDAHSEALEENERRDEEERERIEQESQEAEDGYNKAEEFLKRYKGNKDANLTDILREFRMAFPSSKEHMKDAYDDAFAVFSGKKLKSAARAARVKRGREKVSEIRQRSYEATRNRSSEVYQKALSGSKNLGRAIGRFAKRTATVAKRAGAAGSIGFNAARDAWKASKEAPTTEAEPVTNE